VTDPALDRLIARLCSFNPQTARELIAYMAEHCTVLTAHHIESAWARDKAAVQAGGVPLDRYLIGCGPGSIPAFGAAAVLAKVRERLTQPQLRGGADAAEAHRV